MTHIKLLKKQLNLNIYSDMCDICKPLEKLGIKSFDFRRVYNDGSRIFLGNNPEWLEHFFSHKLYQQGIWEGKPQTYSPSYALWCALPELSNDIHEVARNDFQIDCGISFIKPYKSYCDFYHFGSTPNNEWIYNFYINNINLLENFILYVKDKTKDLIEQQNKTKIILPIRNSVVVEKELSSVNLANECNHLQDLKIKRYHLNNNGSETTLSGKEMLCLLLTAQGKNSKEIADLLRKSKRTIEHCLERVKNSLQVRTKSELLEILYKYNNNLLRLKSSDKG